MFPLKCSFEIWIQQKGTSSFECMYFIVKISWSYIPDIVSCYQWLVWEISPSFGSIICTHRTKKIILDQDLLNVFYSVLKSSLVKLIHLDSRNKRTSWQCLKASRRGTLKYVYPPFWLKYISQSYLRCIFSPHNI